MTIEEKLDLLEQQVSELRTEKEISQLISSYGRMISEGRLSAIPHALFAEEAPDACIEFGAGGPYIGFKKLSTYFEKDLIPGTFSIYAFSSPEIQVESGSSAHGSWVVIGSELDAGELGPSAAREPEARALLSSADEEGKLYRCEWVWQRFSADFCLENGKWKILRLHIYDLLRSPADSDFVRFSTERWATDGSRYDLLYTSNIPFAPGELPENLASGSSTDHWQYAPDAVPRPLK